MKKERKLREVIALLKDEYGEHHYTARVDPLDILVETILSQNTTDKNSSRAFNNLKKKFPKWEILLKTDPRAIQKAIRSGGLPGIKARRIKHVLQDIKRRRGKLELDFLKGMPADEAMEFLQSIKGIGPKTASVLLIFRFNKPMMPLDTHNLRVAKRLGIIPAGMSPEKAHELMNRMVPDEEKKSLHMNFILHGRKICTARNPKCNLCVLNRLCDYYRNLR
ncbi:MAG: Endonuclease III [Candidatus Fermentimicrarchaeum limneticum]|uniref:Endonuclease III n=1 Tax=Fermentimicrarchaeum limneticum TaxID=2795018 RepID=A0A7D6BAH2_FERL1|nr:MAG: Endonuclease III [Candidatus Fermentimicrarchaeum limneticum]